jgi:pimeloyl-ACP methyl ester carboxylesterase
MPLFVEGWDQALHEIGRMSFATVLSAQRAADLLKSVHDLPVLVVAGAEDVLVSLKSAQAMASKFANSVCAIFSSYIYNSFKDEVFPQVSSGHGL